MYCEKRLNKGELKYFCKRNMKNNATNLFQVLHHLILIAIQYTAEKFDNLFVIEVVHILHHSWEEKLHCQV